MISVAPRRQRRLGAVAAGVLASVTGLACASAAPVRTPGATVSSAASSTSPSTSPSTAPSTAASTAAPAGPSTVLRSAWVRVSVATLWRSPSAPRPVDGPALRSPAAITSWLSAMTTADRRDLEGRADSQLLLGQGVRVLGRSGGWVHVVVPGQPTPLDRRGYPGWIPLAQLTFHAPTPATRTATVVARTVRASTARGALVLSLGTTLPVASLSGRSVGAVLPDGSSVSIPATAVSVHARGAAARPPSGAGLVRTARTFLGLPYLWAGTSGFGVDCSGLVELVAGLHGIRLPRDADAQAQAGRAVPVRDLRAGDLLLFARAGHVHHVALYVGDGQMLEAPQTGLRVRIVSTGAHPSDVMTARRITVS